VKCIINAPSLKGASRVITIHLELGCTRDITYGDIYLLYNK
jgi:hypothetical protein